MAAACSVHDAGLPKRYVVVLMVSLGMCIIHAQRVCIGVTVVTILDERPKVGTEMAWDKLPDVDWNSQEIGFLHAIFFIGYIITQLPAGYLSTILPPHRVFGGSILLSCGFNLFLPAAISHGGYVMTCLIRITQGLSEGLLFPSCYAILWQWTTPSERGRLGALVLSELYNQKTRNRRKPADIRLNPTVAPKHFTFRPTSCLPTSPY